MADPAKKFSLVFTKTTKKPNFSVKPRIVEKQDRQLIDCLEGKAIKVKGGEEKVEKKELVIPLQPSCRPSLIKSENEESSQTVDVQIEPKTELAEPVKIKQEPVDDTYSVGETEQSLSSKQPNGGLVEIKVELPDSVEQTSCSLEEQAAREILKEAEDLQKKADGGLNLTLPAFPDSDTLATDPTNEDYENIPVSAFGKAMLKGMGWQEEAGIGKKPQLVPNIEATGPKRLSSSVEQAMRAKTAQKSGNIPQQEDLQLVKGAFVKILTGMMKGEYGEVEGFNDECDRVIVKMSVRGGTVTFSDAVLEVVSKSDFTKNSRVLNSSKYEEVKNKVSQSLEAPRRSSSDWSSRSKSPGDPSYEDHRNEKRRDRSSSRQKKPSAEDRRDRRRSREGSYSPGRKCKSSRRSSSPDRNKKKMHSYRKRSIERKYSNRRDASPREVTPPRRRNSPSPAYDSKRKRDRSYSPDKKSKSSSWRRSPSADSRKKPDSNSRKPSPPRRRDSSSLSPAYNSRRKRDKSRSPEKKSKKDSYRRSPSPPDTRKKSYPRKTSPRSRKNSPSPPQHPHKRSYSSRSKSPEKPSKSSDRKRRNPSSESERETSKKSKKASKKKHKQISSSESSDSSSSPERSSSNKSKKKSKKKKDKRRESSSSPDRRKKSSKK